MLRAFREHRRGCEPQTRIEQLVQGAEVTAYSRITAVMMILAICSGCARWRELNAHPREVDAWDESFGEAPPSNYEEQERAMIAERFSDPQFAESANQPVQRRINLNGTHIRCWCHNVAVNAKNAFGRYAGFDNLTVAWKDGRMISVGVPGDMLLPGDAVLGITGQMLPKVNTWIDLR